MFFWLKSMTATLLLIAVAATVHAEPAAKAFGSGDASMVHEYVVLLESVGTVNASNSSKLVSLVMDARRTF